MERRYLSGNSLTRTDKEEEIDWLEAALDVEFDDELYCQIRRMSEVAIRKLRQLVDGKD